MTAESSRELLAKRAIDIVLGLTAIVLLAPIMLVVAVAILAGMGRPIFFRQPRVGKGGRVFTLFKFRTMNGRAVPGREGIDDAPRLTRVGRAIRRSSLDELPQLINVLRGEMSLVGPRPLLVDYLPLYSAFQARRHEVKPGMTGWAQIRGRNALTWPEKFALDVWYVDHWSLLLDLRIMTETVWHVLVGRGVSANGHVTMERFEGSRNDEPPMSAP